MSNAWGLGRSYAVKMLGGWDVIMQQMLAAIYKSSGAMQIFSFNCAGAGEIFCVKCLGAESFFLGCPGGGGM